MLCLVALQVPVLVRHPSTKELYVNLDPAVHTVVRESEWMRKLGLEIPDSAGIMTYLRDSLKKNFDQLSVRIYFLRYILMNFHVGCFEQFAKPSWLLRQQTNEEVWMLHRENTANLPKYFF